MISQEKITEIRNRASIVEVISDYVTLKKSGRNYMGLCPFHGEKTASFTVNEEKGIFHCFGCHAGGGVFQFLMQYDHLSFPEAVEQVAKRYGIVIERSDARNFQRDLGERENLYRINERAAANYQRILFDHPEGRVALEYLRRRGVDDATARKFMLGFAPQGGSGLVGLVKKESLALADAIKLGLIAQRNPQQYYEKILFPSDVSHRQRGGKDRRLRRQGDGSGHAEVFEFQRNAAFSQRLHGVRFAPGQGKHSPC